MIKRYYLLHTIYLLSLLILAAGCSKELTENPKGLVAGDDAMSSQTGLETVLTGAYGSLMVPWTSGFTTVSQIAMTMGGDDLTTHPGSNKEEFREFDRFNVSSLNSRMNPIWLGCYKTIQATTNIINNYNKVQGGNQDTIRAMVAEASYLRALSYYWLTRLWGAVPIIPSEKYTPEYLNLKKSPPAEIYPLIETDLKRAEEWIPNARRSGGRPNKGTVKALLADVYLTEAGWPLKDQSKYALAAAKAKEVIDGKATYGFDLYMGDYLKIFAGGTVEDVFSLFTRGNWITYNSFYGLSTMPEDEGGWSDFFPELNFFNNFPAGPRKDATFSTRFTSSDGTTISWQQTTTKHPYYKKFTIQSGQKTVYMSNNPVVMMRYAHVLLIYAEAQARSAGTPNGDAYTAVNAVRRRAGLLDLPENMTGPAFAAAVVDERAWEFAGEWNRWFDLIRLEQVEAANANKAAGDLQPAATITKANYWMPIPGADAVVNPNL
ncbi:RagB/SusD family nutrient uptake outer membrane protein [Chitinophaga pendula]|uniref:RagB/SusD family nutrient uptake outer membrane protein n=1 Tax=Chitinophaga TaxID=79328 RepID=UPI000BB01AB7|nr:MULTISPECIES: RagB/SusD family nutrient uptake outer membrane protein [Chitinophaga]ASZ12494.1 RagB/SusD family nutrient uptake outer membrane protein [Chitinophaga sp. MD30]UCJ09905.1 RagB/SusD family nutrient uptake outer membrane protein [Chitinophaga pendula]